MKIDISHKDICSRLCQRCAECCRVTISIKGATTRYRKYLRTIGYNVLPAAGHGKSDCCSQCHDVTLDLGYCKHLDQSLSNGTIFYRCKLYGTSDFPELCADFDCVSWAKHADGYNSENKTLVQAQLALNRLRDEDRDCEIMPNAV